MFALFCPRHGQRVLLDTGRLLRVVNLGDGLILVEARCYDGQPITEVSGVGSRLPADTVGHPPRSSWAGPDAAQRRPGLVGGRR
jgi:hypothetical protein